MAFRVKEAEDGGRPLSICVAVRVDAGCASPEAFGQWVVTFPKGEEQDTTFFLPPSKNKNKFQAIFVRGDFLTTFCLVVPLEFLLSICHSIEHLWLKYPEMTQLMVILEASVPKR